MVIDKLKLQYVPDDWQIHLIIRILRGYDSIFLAGTGYGKSLVFEAVAVLGGKNKVNIIICPLKALEADQVKQANKKGISAIEINEDNTSDASVWTKAEKRAQLVYISPEMALSDLPTPSPRTPCFIVSVYRSELHSFIATSNSLHPTITHLPPTDPSPTPDLLSSAPRRPRPHAVAELLTAAPPQPRGFARAKLPFCHSAVAAAPCARLRRNSPPSYTPRLPALVCAAAPPPLPVLVCAATARVRIRLHSPPSCATASPSSPAPSSEPAPPLPALVYAAAAYVLAGTLLTFVMSSPPLVYAPPSTCLPAAVSLQGGLVTLIQAYPWMGIVPAPPFPTLAYAGTPRARMRRHSPPSCAAAASPSPPALPCPSPRRPPHPRLPRSLVRARAAGPRARQRRRSPRSSAPPLPALVSAAAPRARQHRRSPRSSAPPLPALVSTAAPRARQRRRSRARQHRRSTPSYRAHLRRHGPRSSAPPLPALVYAATAYVLAGTPAPRARQRPPLPALVSAAAPRARQRRRSPCSLSAATPPRSSAPPLPALVSVARSPPSYRAHLRRHGPRSSAPPLPALVYAAAPTSSPAPPLPALVSAAAPHALQRRHARARQHRRSPRSYTPPPPTSSPAPPPPFRHASAPARLRPRPQFVSLQQFCCKETLSFDAGISLDGNCARAPAPHAGTPRARMRRHFPPSLRHRRLTLFSAAPSSRARAATPRARIHRHAPRSYAPPLPTLVRRRRLSLVSLAPSSEARAVAAPIVSAAAAPAAVSLQ
ncbi:hypothetical protein DFH09DRAFT_1391360 [Mycena vulgaris]|nr:hypothetical protein DFH09DRAFT_1391360 [Mycena vulgaris]